MLFKQCGKQIVSKSLAADYINSRRIVVLV